MNDPRVAIAENLARVRERIHRATQRAGRMEDSVRMVAVTKYVDLPVIRTLVEAGCRELGESRPRQLWQRAEALRDLEVAWHLVGHLQRNKVRRTLECVSLIHSVDSERLLLEIDREAQRLGQKLDVLLEVNISGEARKQGLAASEVEPLVGVAAQCEGIRLRGLMGMAQRGPAAIVQAEFSQLRELRDQLRDQLREPLGEQLGEDMSQRVQMDELSMGMSGDFEEAIAEGATIVRIGSALFEGLAP